MWFNLHSLYIFRDKIDDLIEDGEEKDKKEEETTKETTTSEMTVEITDTTETQDQSAEEYL